MMGMDVYGRKPTSKRGEYFRANVWSWRPIHAVIAETCEDLLGEELLRAMGFNDGVGPEDGVVCNKIADRLNAWLEHNAEGAMIECEDIRVDGNGCMIRDPMPGEGRSPYHVRDETLKEWVAFLRDCGGFKVC